MIKSIQPNSTHGWVEVYQYDLRFCWLHLFICRILMIENWEEEFYMGGY
jgi:hypothetical protein